MRTDPKVLEALRKWAADDLRSANAQIDFLLRRALKDAGRLPGLGDQSEKKMPGSGDESDGKTPGPGGEPKETAGDGSKDA